MKFRILPLMLSLPLGLSACLYAETGRVGYVQVGDKTYPILLKELENEQTGEILSRIYYFDLNGTRYECPTVKECEDKIKFLVTDLPAVPDNQDVPSKPEEKPSH